MCIRSSGMRRTAAARTALLHASAMMAGDAVRRVTGGAGYSEYSHWVARADGDKQVRCALRLERHRHGHALRDVPHLPQRHGTPTPMPQHAASPCNTARHLAEQHRPRALPAPRARAPPGALPHCRTAEHAVVPSRPRRRPAAKPNCRWPSPSPIRAHEAPRSLARAPPRAHARAPPQERPGWHWPALRIPVPCDGSARRRGAVSTGEYRVRQLHPRAVPCAAPPRRGVRHFLLRHARGRERRRPSAARLAAQNGR